MKLFEIGDVVQLTSGGSRMTVMGPGHRLGTIAVAMTYCGKFESYSVAPETIVIAQPDPVPVVTPKSESKP